MFDKSETILNQLFGISKKGFISFELLHNGTIASLSDNPAYIWIILDFSYFGSYLLITNTHMIDILPDNISFADWSSFFLFSSISFSIFYISFFTSFLSSFLFSFISFIYLSPSFFFELFISEYLLNPPSSSISRASTMSWPTSTWLFW